MNDTFKYPIMFVGTGSDVGKSVINAAFCRIFKQDGYNPAPFKAQNMSLNSYATSEGLEIGRAQVVQAEACDIPACSDMNPVLLKPASHMNAQVVLNGKPVGTQSASEYFSSDGHNEFEASTVLDFTTYYMTIRGYVYENGTPVERTVRAYIRSDGSFLKETLSDPNDGYYYMNILGSEISSSDMLYVICLDTLQDASYNAIIYDKISAN